jgi:hypothetical protein
MKHSQTIGILASLAVIGVCFMPWCIIVSHNIIVSGIEAKGTDFGRPGLMNIVFSTLSILFFLTPKIWAKRINVLIAALNIAWSFRNYLVVTSCDGGECPEKKAGIFLLLILSAIILAMTFFPRIALPQDRE